MSGLRTEIQRRSALAVKFVMCDSKEEAIKIAEKPWPDWEPAKRLELVDKIIANRKNSYYY